MCTNKTQSITAQQKADINTVFTAADALNNVFDVLYKLGKKYDFPPTQQQSIFDVTDELQNVAFQLATYIYNPAAETYPGLVADKQIETHYKMSETVDKAILTK